MVNKRLLLVVVGTLAAAASCVVSDQLTTLTIAPDGSADWVRFHSNVRSTEKGAKGAEELRRYAEEFDSRRDSDALRVLAAGGELREARWLRRQEPYSTVMSAHLPNAAALVAFFLAKDDKGEPIVRATFRPEGAKRRLSLDIRLPSGEVPAERKPLTPLEQRQEQANGLSETRLAVAGGEICGARGFTVATDKRSALLDPAAIEDLLRAQHGAAELFLEWTVAEN